MSNDSEVVWNPAGSSSSIAYGPIRPRTGSPPDCPGVLSDYGTASPAGTGSGEADDRIPLFGRDRQLRHLFEALEVARRGTCSLVHIRGPSGRGKSALLDRFLNSVSQLQPDPVILHARCHECETLPYRGLDGLIDALAGQLGSLSRLERSMVMPPEGGEIGGVFPGFSKAMSSWSEGVTPRPTARVAGTHCRAFEALRSLLGRLQRLFPVILAMDDLQWADTETVTFLRFLLQPPAPPALMLLLSYRDEAMGTHHAITELRRSIPADSTPAQVTDLPLAPLSLNEACMLAMRLLPAERRSPDRARFVAQRSGGNPFSIVELSRHCIDVAAQSPDASPADLASAISGAVSALNRPSRDLLDVLAVAGKPMTPELLSRVGLLTAAQMSAAVESLKAEAMISTQRGPEGGRLDISHDYVREVTLSLMSKERLNAIHRSIVVSLESSPDPDFEELVSRYRSIGDSQRAWTCTCLAGRQAATRLAFERAARLYRVALETCPAPHLPTLTARLADALASRSTPTEPGAAWLATPGVARQTAEHAPSSPGADGPVLPTGMETSLAAARHVARSLGMWIPRYSLGALVCLVLLRLRLGIRGMSFSLRDPDSIPRSTLVRLSVCFAMSAGLSAHQTLLAIHYQTWLLLLALRTGEPSMLARAFALECSFRAARGQPEERTVRSLQKAARFAAEGRDPSITSLMQANWAVSAFLLGHWEEALGWCESAERLLQEHPGNPWELVSVRNFAAWSLIYLGRWQEARERILGIYWSARDQDDVFSELSMATGVSNVSWLMSDEPHEAIRVNERAMARWPRGKFGLQHFTSVYARAQADLYLQSPMEALRRIRSAWREMRWTATRLVQHSRCEAYELRARCAVAAAEVSRAPETVALLREAGSWASRLAAEKRPGARALANLIVSATASVRGDADAARTGLETTIPMLESAQLGMHALAARFQLGRLSPGPGGRSAAEAASMAIRAQGVVCAETMADVIVPGFRHWAH